MTAERSVCNVNCLYLCNITAGATGRNRVVCRHCARGVAMEIRRPATPPIAGGGTPQAYAVTDDVMYSSSDDDDYDDDSSLHLSSLNDDVDFD